jgi:hypothetical protein
MADALVSPLGRAPGAVSGVYFALKAQHSIDVAKVITIGTQHPDVLFAARNYLAPLFEGLGVDYDPIHVPAVELKGTMRNVGPYVSMVGEALQRAAVGDAKVHIAVTGGRSGMGALAALATNLYGADQMWHLWVKREIEEGGAIDHLYGLHPSEFQTSPYLNPTVEGEGAYDLVNLPFLDLRPLQNLLWHYRQTGQYPDVDKPLIRLLMHTDVERFGEVFPAGLTFEQFDEIMALARAYEPADEERRLELLMEIGAKLQEAGILEAGERQKLLDLMAVGASADDFFALARRASKGRKREGLLSWCQQNKEVIAPAFDLADVGLALISIILEYLRASGYFTP